MLPHLATPEAYERHFRRASLFAPAIATLADRHGLPKAPAEQVKAGSNVIFSVGPRYLIKLFAPLYRDEFERERAGLEAMASAIAVPTPELIAEGELAGWTYMVITRLEGELPRTVWDAVPIQDRLAIAKQMADVAKSIHAAPVPESLTVDWPAFLAKQAAECVERHRQWGANEAWTAQIVPFLERYAPDPHAGPLVLQHADLHDRNVLLKRVRGRWRLAGVLDFGDALVGHREYDFVQLVLWLFHSEAGLLGAFLKRYGLPEPDEAFARRMMAWALLHRFGSLKHMRQLARPRRPRDLETLAEVLFLNLPR